MDYSNRERKFGPVFLGGSRESECTFLKFDKVRIAQDGPARCNFLRGERSYMRDVPEKSE